MNEEIGFEIELDLYYEEAVKLVKEELKVEGFGVLTEIDVQATLKQKMSADFRPYVILGACNPPLAHKALIADPRMGLLLPCNVTVEATDAGGSLVRIINPKFMMGVGNLGKNPLMCTVADDAHERLTRVAQSLAG